MNTSLLDKLRKILALTNSPVEGEAQAAAAMLAKMLEAHNLDIADLEKKGATAKPGVKEEGHDLGKAAFKWKLQLARGIADFYYCHALVDDRLKTVTFIGRPDNVESLRMLYAWVIDQIKRIASDERRNHYIRTNEHIDPLRWQVHFGEGAVDRLIERLKQRRQEQMDAAGTALVVSHRSEVSDYMEQKYGQRVDGRKTKRQEEMEAEWAKWREDARRERERLERLKETDIEAYYAECPHERPEAKARRAAEDEKDRKREERNAKRRRGRVSYDYWRPETPEARRRRQEAGTANEAGGRAAGQINLQPFIGSAKEATKIGGKG